MHLSCFQSVFSSLLGTVTLWACVAQAVAGPPAKAPPGDFAGTKAGQTRQDNGVGTTLVWIPPGDFVMGSPNDEKGRRDDENQVRVTLTKGFWLGQHVVTQVEWQRVMQTAPWRGQRHVKEGADYPATWVTWFDAIKFCEKLTETERHARRLPADWQYTLPTEAQWEYACRAGTKSRFSFGDEESDLGRYAWFGDAGENSARLVGQLKPNPWGLFDMHGNVWEWCLDVYAEKLPGGIDPEFSARGTYQVSRGGCWDTLAEHCRSASRVWNSPGGGDYALGFRVAAVPSAAAELQSGAAADGPLAKALLRDFAGTKAGQTRKDNGLGTTLVWIPPGDFTMGSPKEEKNRGDYEDQVQVTLAKGFWLGQYELTQAEWRRVMQKMPWKGEEHVEEGNDYPAINVSWNDAMRFCEKLTEAEIRAGRLPADWEYTLPTEAQWEYACRAGSKSRFSFGDDDSQLGNYAWFGANAQSTHQVGKKKANAWGLFDMYGNVSELCRDRYVWQLPGGTDPLGKSTNEIRVGRGGCYYDVAETCRSASRPQVQADSRLGTLGFRLAVAPVAAPVDRAANPEPSVARRTPPTGPAADLWRHSRCTAGWFKYGYSDWPILVEEKFANDKPLGPEDLFGFEFEVFIPEELKDLPDLDQPFAIQFRSTSRVNDYGSKRLDPAANLRALRRLKHLVQLDIDGIGDAGLAGLADLPQLRALSALGDEVSEVGVRQIARLPNLKTLRLATWFTDRALKELAGMKKLERLAIYSGRVTDAGMVDLLALPNLRSLRLVCPQITDAALDALCRSKTLEELDLGGTTISDAGLAKLAAANNLRSLSLYGTRVSNDGMRHLGKCTQLRKLDIGYTSVTDAGLAYLAHLPRLETLKLGPKSITDDGLKTLESLPRLQFLDLTGTEKGVTVEGLTQLARVKHLKGLRGVAGIPGLRSVEDLQKALPNVQVDP